MQLRANVIAEQCDGTLQSQLCRRSPATLGPDRAGGRKLHAAGRTLFRMSRSFCSSSISSGSWVDRLPPSSVCTESITCTTLRPAALGAPPHLPLWKASPRWHEGTLSAPLALQTAESSRWTAVNLKHGCIKVRSCNWLHLDSVSCRTYAVSYCFTQVRWGRGKRWEVGAPQCKTGCRLSSSCRP